MTAGTFLLQTLRDAVAQAGAQAGAQAELRHGLSLHLREVEGLLRTCEN
jgi:hypothetical protein